MRKVFSAAFVLGVCALCANASAQNLLGNPSLEAGSGNNVAPWILIEDPATANTAEVINFGASSNHDGNLGLWLREFEGLFFPGPFPNTSEIDAILTQFVPATAGNLYIFSGWSRWETNYSGGVTTLAANAPGGARPSPTQTTMSLEFLDDAFTVLGSVNLDLRTEQSNDGTWRQHVLSGTAPAGTTQVQVSASAINMVPNIDPGQSAFFDDFALRSEVPEPSAIALGALGLAAAFGLKRRS